jgi:hypothetical protein
MEVRLTSEEVADVLAWAEDSDAESRLTNYPLVERLAAAVGRDPAEVAPEAAHFANGAD